MPAKPTITRQQQYTADLTLLNIVQADVRSPGAATPKWDLSADAECAAWSLAQPTQFLVASEDGVVACFDARSGAGTPPLFRLAAHDKPTCSLSFCPAAPNLLATASADKLVSTFISLLLSLSIFGMLLLEALPGMSSGAAMEKGVLQPRAEQLDS